MTEKGSMVPVGQTRFVLKEAGRSNRVANASLVPIDRAMARNCTRAWRRVAARVPCGDRCKWMLANFAGIGWEGALRRIAVEYKQKCGALARPECATVLADERKKIRIGAGVGSSGK